MTDYTNLIARLEAAEGPSRELDSEIFLATASEAFLKQLGYPEPNTWNSLAPAPLYTASLDAAVSLVSESMVLQSLQRRIQPEMGGRMWSATIHGYKLFRSGGQRTPALALCIAALKARQAEND